MGVYVSPSVTAAGLIVPSYQQILNLYVTNFLSIYGQSNSVSLTPDDADYQQMSSIALAVSDVMQAALLAFNNRGPNFAIGAGLDTLGSLIGITRKPATASTCPVVLTGTAATVITNGVVQDVNGNQWALPSFVTIGSGGTVTVTATCTVVGATSASANQINIIFAGATAGWISVNNSSPAAVGQPVETDAQFRARYAQSVALPSITELQATIAAIEGIPGVTRLQVDENFTGSTNGNGNPAHSITCVVEGGTQAAIAQAIWANRGIGALTNGTTTVDVVDPNSGIVTAISFIQPPTYTPIYVIVNAHLLTGGTSATITAIQTAVVNYLNSLQIGESVYYTSLIAAAMSVNPNPSLPIVKVSSLFLATTPTPTVTTDIAIVFGVVASGVTADVTVNPV